MVCICSKAFIVWSILFFSNTTNWATFINSFYCNCINFAVKSFWWIWLVEIDLSKCISFYLLHLSIASVTSTHWSLVACTGQQHQIVFSSFHWSPNIYHWSSLLSFLNENYTHLFWQLPQPCESQRRRACMKECANKYSHFTY